MSQYKSFAVTHPAHITFINSLSVVNLDQFFAIMDTFDVSQRDGVLGYAYYPILQPRSRAAITGEESIKDLFIDEVSYDAFKKRCYIAGQVIDQGFLVYSIVTFCLQQLFQIADPTNLAKKMEHNTAFMDNMELYVKVRKGVIDPKQLDELSQKIVEVLAENFKDRPLEELEAENSKLNDMFSSIPERNQDNYRLYERFCDQVIVRLNQLNEEIIKGRYS